MCDCYDAPAPEVYQTKMVTARKPHRCWECRDPIAAGDRYELTKGLWEGSWGSFKTCADCAAVKEYAIAHFNNPHLIEAGE